MEEGEEEIKVVDEEDEVAVGVLYDARRYV